METKSTAGVRTGWHPGEAPSAGQQGTAREADAPISIPGHNLVRFPGVLAAKIEQMTSASALADFIAGLMDLAPSEKQEVLETIDLRVRIDKVLRLLASRLAVLRLSREIGEQTQERLEERQREVLLR